MRKQMLVFILSAILVISGCGAAKESGGADQSADYPNKSINGTISWGAGGATDNVARTFAPQLEKHLGQSIILTNKPGATGAIATQYVHQLPSDGYNLLFGSESAGLFGIMDISDVGLNDFSPVSIVGGQIMTLAVSKNSEWDTLEEFVEFAKNHPGEIKIGSPGAGTAPEVTNSMLTVEKGIEFTVVPFDGESPALTALLGGQVDAAMPGNTLASQFYQSGDVKILTVFHDQRIEQMPDVRPIVEIYPEFKKYFPWGTFYGVWVKKDTPDAIKAKLFDAAEKAFNEPELQEKFKQMGVEPIGLSGEEAENYISKWLSTTGWLLYEAGSAKRSPEELGIPRPE